MYGYFTFLCLYPAFESTLGYYLTALYLHLLCIMEHSAYNLTGNCITPVGRSTDCSRDGALLRALFCDILFTTRPCGPLDSAADSVLVFR